MFKVNTLDFLFTFKSTILPQILNMSPNLERRRFLLPFGRKLIPAPVAARQRGVLGRRHDPAAQLR